MELIECQQCWKVFKPVNWIQKFCCEECRKDYRNKKIVCICKKCWKEFEWTSIAHYCEKCRLLWVNTKRVCPYCWKEFERETIRQIYCSKKCAMKFNEEKLYTLTCEICWKEFQWRRRCKYCSKECEIIWFNKNCQSTNLEKRGLSYSTQDESVKAKIASTCINKYWCKSFLGSEECKEIINKKNYEEAWVLWNCQRDYAKKWTKKISKANLEFWKLLEDNWIKIDGYEYPVLWFDYDLKVWDTLIEVDPLAYHNETWHPYDKFKWPKYHKIKTWVALKNWYKCIHVFDWDDKMKIVNLLKHKQSIYARNCQIGEIDKKEANNFINKFHLQWALRYKKTTIYIWLYYNNMLVMCMSFGEPRKKTWCKVELLRLCTHWDYNIIWWASKMFKYYINKYNPSSIVSYCDRSKFTWEVYEKLWFEFVVWNEPSKHWVNTKNNWAKKHIWWSELNSRGFDQLLWKYFWYFWKWTNNEELIKQHGYVDVYDAWQATYIRTNATHN